ncbi:recombinase, partial [Methylobacterium fujisawaense]
QGSFDLRLRTALGFLANPCQLWQNGMLEDRRAVLKLTFADRLRYKRGEGFRTANLTLPFKVLADFATGGMGMAHPTRFERVTFA